MARPLDTKEETFRTEEELFSYWQQLSQAGGAWVCHRRGFSHTFVFDKFQSPSRVPDWYHDLSRGPDGRRGCISYKGKFQRFTKAARRREQNRGLSRGY